MPTIVVHGGAGEDPPGERAARAGGVERAADVGAAVLTRGGTALEAVVEAVAVLEDDPLFNAGLGSVLTQEGTIEMDASVMEGAALGAGAVATVRDVANPVRAALAVLREGREVLMVGEPVHAIAERHGLRIVAPDALVTPEALARWRRRRATAGNTVGAVAVDTHGHVAAATSTGGVAGKRRGRVGDSAVIGAGTYADDATGAVSATGPGEAIIRLGLARVALACVAAGIAPADATTRALALLRERTGAEAGLIVVARDGTPGVAFTTAGMPAAVRRS
ncbi:MAG TPA: isoaspartyl peptidase/L-asparaginase [Candidatus Eisenbacteria bacterium]|nr:isoaspartyl peptidase/L-asparaginase [Candidatus Eisenbacteria bacterium]